MQPQETLQISVFFDVMLCCWVIGSHSLKDHFAFTFTGVKSPIRIFLTA